MKSARNSKSGFTLIELLVAVTILTCITSVLYQTFNVSIRAYRKLEREGVCNRNVRQSWRRISRDLRCAFMSQTNKGVKFTGKRKCGGEFYFDSVRFVTYVPLTQKESGGLAEVEYMIDTDLKTDEKGLVRKYFGFPVGKSGEKCLYSQEIAPLARSLKLQYFDGNEWLDNWGEEGLSRTAVNSNKKLPSAVKISVTISLDENSDEKKVFATIIPVYSGS